MNTFGARLRAARNGANMTQQRLGDAVGVSKGAVSRWESDMDQPQFAVLQPLRQALRISLDELICGESAPRRPGGVLEQGARYDGPDPLEWALLKHYRREPRERLEALLVALGIERP